MADLLFENPTPEEAPFVDAVCATPGDYAPRAVFADWLEERGDPRGEWLRASIQVEHAIERLGWGYAFACWRGLLPQVVDDPTFSSTVAKARSVAKPHSSEFPAAIGAKIVRHYRCGGFLENVGIGSRPLVSSGAELRRRIPLRGVFAAEIPRRQGGIELLRHPLDAWRGVERFIDSNFVWSRESDFAPFATDERADRFVELATDLTALATARTFGEEFGPLFRFLRSSRLKSLLILSSFVPVYGPNGLLENWQPDDLRCLGLPNCELTEGALIRLADWPGLSTVRLLDISRSAIGSRARRALLNSAYRHPDLCIVHDVDPQVPGESLDPIRTIGVRLERDPPLQRPAELLSATV